MLDYIIPLNERHLCRLLREYVSYHNEDRIHDTLNKDAPTWRPVEQRPSPRWLGSEVCIIASAGEKLHEKPFPVAPGSRSIFGCRQPVALRLLARHPDEETNTSLSAISS
jgi:hypothetical protein